MLPAAYQSQVHQLAIGFEPIDELRRQRTSHPVVMQVESPLGNSHRPNKSYNDVSYPSDSVPRIARGEYGTHRMLYLKRHTMPEEMVVRITDDQRRFVPRRFRLAVPPQIDQETEQRPLASRKQTPLLLPGAAYDFSRKSTGLRGRVLRDGSPMRWAWVDAFLLINIGTEEVPVFVRQGRIGRAISDDRGEFLLLLNTMPISQTGIADLTDPLWVNVVINGPTPAPASINTDDPYWDLPIEEFDAAGQPDPAANENYVPSGYAADVSIHGNKNVPFRIGEVLTGSEVEDFVCNLP